MTDQVTDPSIYDVATLAKWYIDLRNSKSEIKRSIEPSLAQIEQQMEAIESELNKRILESGVKSMRTENGTITRVLKTKYTVVDKYAFRQWVQENPDVASGIISASISQEDVRAYVEDNNPLPVGVALEQSFDISVRRT